MFTITFILQRHIKLLDKILTLILTHRTYIFMFGKTFYLGSRYILSRYILIYQIRLFPKLHVFLVTIIALFKHGENNKSFKFISYLLSLLIPSILNWKLLYLQEVNKDKILSGTQTQTQSRFTEQTKHRLYSCENVSILEENQQTACELTYIVSNRVL